MRPGRMISHAAGAFLLHGDHALFQRRSPTEHEPLTWCIYGGVQEPYETPLETAAREIWEESGIDIAGLPVMKVGVDVQGPTFAFHTFLVRLPAPASPVHSSESVDAAWIRLGGTAPTLWANLPYPLHSGLARSTRDPGIAAAVLSETLAARAAQGTLRPDRCEDAEERPSF